MSFLFSTTKTDWINKSITIDLEAENLLETVVTDASLAPRVKGIASTITKIQQGGIKTPKILGFLINSIVNDEQSVFLAIYILVNKDSKPNTYSFCQLYVVDKEYQAGNLWYYDDKTFSITLIKNKNKQASELLYFTSSSESLSFTVTSQTGEVVEINEHQTMPSVIDAKAIATISFDDVDLDELLAMEKVLKQAIALRRARKLSTLIRSKNIHQDLALSKLSYLIDEMAEDEQSKVQGSKHVHYLSKVLDITYSLLPDAYLDELNT